MDSDFFESEDDVLLKFCDSSDSSDDDLYDTYSRCYLITSLPLLFTAISLATYKSEAGFPSSPVSCESLSSL